MNGRPLLSTTATCSLPAAPYSIETVAEKIGEPTAELEKVEICENAAFWSFDRKLYAKANWWKKTAAPGIGEMITIRTANTFRKISEMYLQFFQ